jgi:protein-tyrosine phosphatase
MTPKLPAKKVLSAISLHLHIVSNPKRTPILVHCQHGSDRTGMMCAMYRIVLQGWTEEAAIKEMIDRGYGFHEVWANIAPWINNLDVARIKTQAGL